MVDEKLIAVGNRIATALEKMAEDPVLQMEFGPPVCPHCGVVNPKVRASESESEGSLGDSVFQFACIHCQKMFFGLPINWQCVTTIDEAAEALRERAEIQNATR